MSNAVTYNESSDRYEMVVGNEVVFARCRSEGGILYINYVEAPPSLRGTGAADKFMKGLMEIVRTEKLKVIPICGYAAGWLQRHSEYQDLITS
jgi:predicted GNAT family acetyltransferase